MNDYNNDDRFDFNKEEQNKAEKYGVSYTPGENGYNYSQYGGATRADAPPKKPLKNSNAKKSVAALLLAAVMLLSGFFGVMVGANIAKNALSDENGETDSPIVSKPAGNAVVYKNSEVSDYSTSLTEVIAAVKPSVVEIETEYTVSNSIFGNYTQSGAGSGVVLMNDESDARIYYIVTNNHVIENSKNIKVRLTDGSEYTAYLIGTDIFTDVALLKITVDDGKTLNTVSISNSDDLLDGQEVFAVGNPLGTLGGSVSRGIISCTERKISVDGIKMTLLQTDAAVNPGNSGGALFDTLGNLVGIVNAKYSSETVEGIGFAIPTNRVMKTVESLYTYGYVKGIATLELSLSDQSYSGGTAGTLTRPTLSQNSSIGGVAENESGKQVELTLEKGDFIDSVNGVSVSSTNALLSLLSEYEIGDTVELTVYRPELTSSFWGRYEYVKYTVSVELTEYVPSYINEQ